MDRYTIGFLIFVGWFVCFRMFPASIGGEGRCAVGSEAASTAGPSDTWDANQSKGKLAFDANCARCHNSRLEKHSTGPALLGVSSRIPGGDWIYEWVRNSAKLIESGDPYAVRVWEENNKASMDPFPALSNETIDDIMGWINSYRPMGIVAMP
jgi:cytochrome c2